MYESGGGEFLRALYTWCRLCTEWHSSTAHINLPNLAGHDAAQLRRCIVSKTIDTAHVRRCVVSTPPITRMPYPRLPKVAPTVIAVPFCHSITCWAPSKRRVCPGVGSCLGCGVSDHLPLFTLLPTPPPSHVVSRHERIKVGWMLSSLPSASRRLCVPWAAKLVYQEICGSATYGSKIPDQGY